MKQLERFLMLIAAVSLGAAAGFGFPTSAAAGGEPCNAKKFKFSQVKQACNEGGLRGAKNLMKESVKRAKAAGNDYKCSTCHENQRTFELKKDAAEKLEPYL